MVVTTLCEMAGRSLRVDVAQELGDARIKRDHTDIENLETTICETQNPFGEDLRDDNLYCMTTGVALKDDIAEELINLVETGEQWMNEFIEECKVRPE